MSIDNLTKSVNVISSDSNIFFDDLDKYINIINKYLPEHRKKYKWLVDLTFGKSNIFSQIHNNNIKNKDPLQGVSWFDIDTMKDHISCCLDEVVIIINHKINDDENHSVDESCIDDENNLCRLIVNIQRLSKNKIDFSHMLNKFYYFWANSLTLQSKTLRKCLLNDDGIEKFDFYINKVEEFFDKKQKFFNELTESEKNIFGLPHLYLGIIYKYAYLRVSNRNEIIINTLVNKLFKLFQQLNYIDNNDTSQKIQQELIKVLKMLSLRDNKNIDIFFEIFKIVNLNEHLNENDMDIFKNLIIKGDVKFFDKIFESFPELNNIRLKLLKSSIQLDSLDMFDYFLDDKYIVEINQIKEMNEFNLDILKTKIPWVNDMIKNHILEYDNILFHIHECNLKDLFVRVLFAKKNMNLNPVSIHNFIAELESKKLIFIKRVPEKQVNFTPYLDFIKPFLNVKLLENSIKELDQLDRRVDVKILDNIRKSLTTHLVNLKQNKKINSIKLKS